MGKYIILLIYLTLSHTCFADEGQLLSLNLERIESLFLKQNLRLIAEKMNVDIADAEIVQAKLWSNPEISVGDVNFWTEPGNNTQFSVELSQMITTAGKRRKLVNIGQVSKDIAVREFEELLNGLKFELRNSVHELIYWQDYIKVLDNQIALFEKLVSVYEKQLSQGNVAKSEILRLQSSVMELESERNEAYAERNSRRKELKTLLRLDHSTILEIESDEYAHKNVLLTDLLDKAMEHRPEIARQSLQTDYYEKSLIYEKSLKIPDLKFSANYDRFGGVWRDFAGIGLSFNLPVFDRNQGNVKAAEARKRRSKYMEDELQNTIQNEVREAFDNYVQAYGFYKKIHENEFVAELETMLDANIKNFANRNIGMLEYLDFMNVYKANKQTVLTVRKNLDLRFEALKHAVGTEIE